MPGCPVRQEAAKPPESPELVTKPATPEPATRPVANASGYIKCVGRLVKYIENYQWTEFRTTESGVTEHATCGSRNAMFRISSPSIYAGRTVGVLHQYEADLFTTSPPISKVKAGGLAGYSIETPEDSSTVPTSRPISQEGKDFSIETPEDSSTVPTSRPMSPKGLDYSFEIPEDYFTGNFGTIRHHYIRNFRAVP
jgi:hypothetical protein